MTASLPYYDRSFMARVVFAWLFGVLVYFFSIHSLLSQLQEPVMIYPGSDNTFWFFHALHIPQFLLHHHSIALAFDVLLTCSCLICVFVPDQRLFTWITVAGVWLLYITYCSAAGKHYAQIGFLLAPIPFIALPQKKFTLLWECFRYWVCFLYFSAGVYKIYYGGFTAHDNMSNILMQMEGDWFLFHKGGLQADTILFLIKHPEWSQWFYRLVVVIDLALIIGFFTRKYDHWLLIALVSFHAGNLFFLHIPFVEQSLIFAPFLPWHRWSRSFKSTTDND